MHLLPNLHSSTHKSCEYLQLMFMPAITVNIAILMQCNGFVDGKLSTDETYPARFWELRLLYSTNRRLISWNDYSDQTSSIASTVNVMMVVVASGGNWGCAVMNIYKHEKHGSLRGDSICKLSKLQYFPVFDILIMSLLNMCFLSDD